MSGAEPVVAQPAPTFQARIDAAALALRDSNPRLRRASRQFVQGLAEFVSGNLLFVLLHEMAHASITQMGLPVLGKMEDAADTFAALRLIRVGSVFASCTHRGGGAGSWRTCVIKNQETKVPYYDGTASINGAYQSSPDGQFRRENSKDPQVP